MLSWQKVMVVYIVVMVFLAVLLGSIGDPVNVSFFLSRPAGISMDRGSDDGASGDGSCPWQLHVVSMRQDTCAASRVISSVPLRTNGS